MNEKIRDILPYGYRAYTGMILCDCHIDSLNVMNRNINSFINAGMIVPEYLLNGCHKLFVDFSMVEA